jgi:hypothetical protein
MPSKHKRVGAAALLSIAAVATAAGAPAATGETQNAAAPAAGGPSARSFVKGAEFRGHFHEDKQAKVDLFIKDNTIFVGLTQVNLRCSGLKGRSDFNGSGEIDDQGVFKVNVDNGSDTLTVKGDLSHQDGDGSIRLDRHGMSLCEVLHPDWHVTRTLA